MAAEALVKAGRELGVEVKVEKQGANGIEDRHTKQDIDRAVAIIYAVDVSVKEEERFGRLPKVKTSVASPLRKARKLLETAVEKGSRTQLDESPRPDQSDHVQEEKESWRTEVKSSLLTGISHIIPIIVAGGMTLAVAVFISQIFDLQDLYAEEGSWLWLLRQLGGSLDLSVFGFILSSGRCLSEPSCCLSSVVRLPP